MNVTAIVLAAGQGKRMKSKLYKVLHPVCGIPMIGHVTNLLAKLNVNRTIVIVGHGADKVKEYLGGGLQYTLQEEQLGTGHAVLQAEGLIGNEEGLTIVVCGDTPLITENSMRQMIELHKRKNAAATVLSAYVDQPHGYGRLIRDPASGKVLKIVEQKDCSADELEVKEINTATYCFDNRKLFHALSKVTNQNAQQEYYLTDVIGILREFGESIEGYCCEDEAEAIGVNDRVSLAEAERLMRARINRRHMLAGVSMIDPSQTYIEAGVEIGEDTVLYPGTALRGSTVIGSECLVGPNTEITHSTIGNHVVLRQSVIEQAKVGDHTSIGPFAYLRPGSVIGSHCKIGDFVEIKNAVLDDGSKVSHLSYVGDARIGKNVNIGCGAITVNYDGFNKHLTQIEDDAFIGSNVNLIAPIVVGKGAYVVAGSTITRSVPENDVAIARERQTNKAGYANELRKRIKQKKADQ